MTNCLISSNCHILTTSGFVQLAYFPEITPDQARSPQVFQEESCWWALNYKYIYEHAETLCNATIFHPAHKFKKIASPSSVDVQQ